MSVFHISLANGKTFPASVGQTLLEAAEAAGLALQHSCRTGRCGTCVATPTSGRTRARQAAGDLLVGVLAKDAILTCTHEATSDLRLDACDLDLTTPVKLLPCRIDALERVATDVMSVALRLPPNAGFRYRSGQSIDVIGRNGLKRSYSIANAPGPNGESTRVELHVRGVPDGAMSAYWFGQARLNDLLRLQGPRGTFLTRDAADHDLVFLATGTGIAPVKAMLEELDRCSALSRPRSIRLFWGGRVPSDLYWDPRERRPELDFVPVLSRAGAEWNGRRGHIQDVWLSSGAVTGRTQVYACGSPAMIDGTRRALAAAGLPGDRFHYDAFVASN